MAAQKNPGPTDGDESQAGPEDFDPFSPAANLVSGPDATFKAGQVRYKEGRPRKDEFFRIHPDPDMCHDYPLLILDDGKDKETYIVYTPAGKVQRGHSPSPPICRYEPARQCVRLGGKALHR
jgi:hypothetical protein